MDQQNSWKYCKATTNKHPVAIKFKQYVEEIHSVCINEGAKKTSFSKEKCINLDKIEWFIAKKEKRNALKTMDISFGIKSGNKKRIALCELRLNFENVYNLKKSDIDSKISHSIDILGHSLMIYNFYLFIFKSDKKNQANYVLRRLYSNKNMFEILDLYGLKNKYF
jgi:hypothetical protein